MLVACQQEIDFKKELGNDEITLNSFIACDSTIQVSLSRNLYINEFEAFETNESATVLLYENNKFIEQLKFEEIRIKNRYSENEGQPDSISKFYYTSQAKVNAGMNYRVEVEENSETILKAETYVPSPVQISSIDTFITFTDWGRWIDVKLHFNIHFNDLAEEINYYRIGMKYHTGSIATRIQEEDTISYINTFYDVRGTRLSDSDPVLSTENKDANSILFGAIENKYTILSDEIINGQDCKIDIALRYYIDDGTTVPYKEELGEFFHIKLQLHSLSEDAYTYLSSIDKQIYNDDLPFVEPVPIYSNIENGNGIFAGYSVSEMELKIGEYPMEGIIYDLDEN